MTLDPRLIELLVRDEELREQGLPVSPEELCADCPDLIEPLKRQLRVVERLDAMREIPESVDEPGSPYSGSATPSASPVLPGESVSTGSTYRVLRFHARGGLGEVLVAQDEELHREVALKQIQRLRVRDPQSRRRFLWESEITGRLEHPGIVPVYGWGKYRDDCPFYIMRFVKGETLHEAIRRFHQADQPNRDSGEHSLALRQLLTRFVAVCNAVGYAHSRGILHRDLKPGNVIMGRYGETLVLDWGLAKPFDHSLSDPPHEEEPLKPRSNDGGQDTQTGYVIGTLAYMSPEQAAGLWDIVGPRSDIYSLGATLYEILSGVAPFSSQAAGVVNQIQRGEFVAPCQVKKAIPRSLEAICLKAMALKPEDRYTTALELAADIEHWLADEPVTAYRERIDERVARWFRKHPRIATAIITVLVTATVGLAVGLYFVNAEKNRTELARQGEELQRIEAQKQEAVTRAALGFVENKVFAAARPKEQEGGMGHDVKLADALKASLRFVETSFKDQPLVEARLRLTLGNSFGYLGNAEIAAEQYQAARALYTKHRGPNHADTLDSMNNLAVSYFALGRYDDALKLNKETLERRRANQDPDHPDTLGSTNNVADCYYALGRYADALPLYEETLARRKDKLGHDHPDTIATMNNLANCYAALGRKADALTLREKTLALRKVKLGQNHPDTLAAMNNLAASYTDVGRHADALKLNKETLARRIDRLGPDHPDTLISRNNVAASYAALGRHADALPHYKETLARMKASHGPDHPHTLASMGNLAECLIDLDRGAEAIPIIDECLKRATGKVVHPQLIPMVMDLRLRHFEKSKDAAGCRATAEMWEKLTRTDADSLHTAASMRAVTAGVIRAGDKSAVAAKDAAAEADRAMAWLRRAVAAGYKNVAHMKQDKNLDALRDREDFRKLLAELEAKINKADK